MWLLGAVRHANVAVECIVKESMQRAPCWAAGRPFGLPRANVPACRGDLPRRFQDPAID